MKVDIKIVPIEVKEGWFKKKQMQQLQWVITLTDVEKAIINKAGLREFTIIDFQHSTPDGSYSETFELPIRAWVDETVPAVPGYGHGEYNTLIEAQAAGQKLKANLVHLKEAMELHTDTPTEESFEL